MKSVISEPDTLLEFLKKQYPDSPGVRIKKLLKGGAVRINGLQVTLNSYQLKPGDIVIVEARKGGSSHKELPFPVLFEDKEIIIIDKPAGIATSSSDGSANVYQIVSAGLQERTKGKVRAFIVHRLDKEVSGVLMFAKSEEGAGKIKERWKETDKHYFAFVEGVPVKESGTIKGWLIEDGKQLVHSTSEKDGARFAVTHFRILKTIGANALLDVNTETGRKNQIRVHLSESGHPIIGDRRYGASGEYKRRIRLHACSLTFPHPGTGETITVESPMPRGFLLLKPHDEKYK